jgi:hypothetical protein
MTKIDDGGPASEDKELERETTRVARHHGCDRAVFTVCWGELEKGLECRCKADAKRNLRARSRKESPNGEEAIHAKTMTDTDEGMTGDAIRSRQGEVHALDMPAAMEVRRAQRLEAHP